MCIKIIGSEQSLEFNPSEPLEQQVTNAKEVVVNYDPEDPMIDNIKLFVNQMERLCKNGISCTVDIKVNSNNHLNGIRLERQIEKLKNKLDVNELVKKVSSFHYDAEHGLCELSEMCKEK